jgi:uncharacterized protein
MVSIPGHQNDDWLRMFIGRDREMALLEELFHRKSAAFVICRGRRRIGKSRLIQEFGRKHGRFLEFQGLPPREGMRPADQLRVFAQQLAKHTRLPELRFDSWPQAFAMLAAVIKNQKTIILLDEISWMASQDKDFAGYLKIAWDTELKKFSKLIVVACGSVSSWIDQNILNNTGFVGRVSLELTLAPLSIFYCNQFWGNKSHRTSSMEKLKILSVIGGIPRYLEEINTSLSAEENIKRLCFTKEGILFSEFDQIFNDIFSKRAPTYKAIVQTLLFGSRSPGEVSAALHRERTGHVSHCLEDLVASGFLEKDSVYEPGTARATRRFRYRLKDNYLRFYLRYIEPKREKIRQGFAETSALEAFVDWDVIMGYQFENLVFGNIPALCKHLAVNCASVQSAAPYFQKSTQRKKSCQIDLLMQTRHTLYVCEIKFRKRIEPEVIGEVQEKISTLHIPKHMSVRPVLIYEGARSNRLRDDDYFTAQIAFGDLLTS